MPFHRFSVPSYSGGLPGGYDYINNASGGTPAPADGPLGSGPNAGSYFFGQSEQATAAAWNRAARALAENTDYLDDLLRKDLAIPVRTADAISPTGGLTQIVLTGPGIYLGEAGTPNTVEGIRQYFQVVDENDNEIYNDSFGTVTECVVTSISGGTIGSNSFSVGNVTLDVSIPAGVTYRVYFWMRGNLATLPPGVLVGRRRLWNRVNKNLVPFSGNYQIPAGTTTTRAIKELLEMVSTRDRFRELNFSGTSEIIHGITGGTYNPVMRDGTVVLSPSSSSVLNLPPPAQFKGWTVRLLDARRTLSSSKTVTLVPNGTNLINGVNAPYVLSEPGGSWLLTTDGNEWWISSSQFYAITATANLTLPAIAREHFINVNTPSGGISLTLPNPANCTPGQSWIVSDIAGTLATSPVTMVRHGSEKIGGLASNLTLNASWGSWTFFTDGTDWFFR